MIIIPATVANQKAATYEGSPFDKGSKSYGFCKDILDISSAWKTKFDVTLKNEHSSFCFLLHFPSNKMLSLEADDYTSGPIDHPNSVWIEFNINSFEDSTQNFITLNSAYKQTQVVKEEIVRVDDIEYKQNQSIYITYSNKQMSLFLTSFLTSNLIFSVSIDLTSKLNSNICWCGFSNINNNNSNNYSNNSEIENELNCNISHWIWRYIPADLVVSDTKLSIVNTIIPPLTVSSLLLFGLAKLEGGNVSMINKKSNSVSAAYYNKKINLSQNWEISFMYELTGSADGFTFVMQSNYPATPKGTGKMLGCGSINNALILEFDIYTNSEVNDPCSPHVALFGYSSSNAILKHKTDAEIGKFKTTKIEGKQVVRIIYDGLKMVVRITDIKTNDSTELISTLVKLDKYLKTNEAYIGFTASTGEKTMNLTINSLDFCSTENDVNMSETSHNIFLLNLLICLSLARVLPEQRKFVSNAVDKAVADLKSKIKDSKLAEIFENAYPNTLDTTIYSFKNANRSITGKTDTFVVTGDIHAMWLRDSCNQVLPYFRFVNEDPQLKEMLKGVLNRQLDPYANAFNYDSTGHPDSHRSDSTTKPDYLGSRTNAMMNEIFERKYEIDSLAAMLKLSYAYYKNTNDLSPFDSDWIIAVNNIIEVVKDMQKETIPGVRFDYFFQRESTQPTESLQNGFGFPGKKTNLSRSSFRPSDDACTFPYLIPGNAMMVVELRHSSEILLKIKRDDLSNIVLQLANEIEAAIYQYGIRKDPDFGEILTYEVNGYGSDYFMDDANIPSLLSLPYIGFIDYNNTLYQRTRKAVLCNKNPYFFKDSNSDLEGTGGPHNGLGWIWPMSIIIRIMTTDDQSEIMRCLEMLKVSAVNNYIHESFWFNNPGSITRPWFAWANSLFGEMIFDLAERHPNLILK